MILIFETLICSPLIKYWQIFAIQASIFQVEKRLAKGWPLLFLGTGWSLILFCCFFLPPPWPPQLFFFFFHFFVYCCFVLFSWDFIPFHISFPLEILLYLFIPSWNSKLLKINVSIILTLSATLFIYFLIFDDSSLQTFSELSKIFRSLSQN